MAETWYERHVLPRVLDFGCGHSAVSDKRRRVLPVAEGRVVEVGFGSGLNLPFYDPAKVVEVIGVDPSTTMLKRAEVRIAASPIPVSIEALSSEALPFDDGDADSLVCTFSLRTIPDPRAALREMRRVLKPGGRLIFAEHGASPDPAVRRWQDRLNGVWGRIAGGCNINRPILTLLEQAGFATESVETGYLKGAPRITGYCFSGFAQVAQ